MISGFPGTDFVESDPIFFGFHHGSGEMPGVLCAGPTFNYKLVMVGEVRESCQHLGGVPTTGACSRRFNGGPRVNARVIVSSFHDGWAN